MFDVEYTTWEGALERDWSGPQEMREVVQIGAARVCPSKNWEIVEELDLLVKPTINPRLSDYFINLTGISQDQLDRNGIAYRDAVEQLTQFSAPKLPLLSNGKDGCYMKQNADTIGLYFPLEKQCHNIHDKLCAAAGTDRSLSSWELPEIFGLDTSEQPHNALGDVRSIVSVLHVIKFQWQIK